MVEEITLEPGWLQTDIRRARKRLAEWAIPRARFDVAEARVALAEAERKLRDLIREAGA